MIKTVGQLDEMRARVLAREDSNESRWKFYLQDARAIRLADEAADFAREEYALLGATEDQNPVYQILKGYRSYISARPELVSLLYDIDMLPEQTVTRAGAVRLAGLCEVWKRYEAAISASPFVEK